MNVSEVQSLAAQALSSLRQATLGTPYEGQLYLVGGALRDRVLGVPHGADLDFVLEGNALDLALFLYDKGLSSHFPVLYPRFGTAMVHLVVPEFGSDDGVAVELVTARSESYQPDSRKPNVRSGTLREDIYRRDFTINTLAENLHSGEVLDITGRAMDDLRDHVIRTPVEPQITFFDDPLRMLRAVRFASRFDFHVDDSTWSAIQSEAHRLQPPTIAFERIREELSKISMLPGKRFRAGMELLLQSGLLAEFLPEMLPMIGCVQGDWHRYDVWDHTMVALEALPDDAPQEVRLGLLWHDIGKPSTRSESQSISSYNYNDNDVARVRTHFYGHPRVGAEMTRSIMSRLKFSNEEIHRVVELVKQHMRLGDYKPDWDDPAVKRLVRDTHGVLDHLFTLTKCDQAAVEIPPEYAVDLTALRRRTDSLITAVAIESPLDGNTIMKILGLPPGPQVKEAKEHLVNAVIDGRLKQDDSEAARAMLERWWQATNP